MKNLDRPWMRYHTSLKKIPRSWKGDEIISIPLDNMYGWFLKLFWFPPSIPGFLAAPSLAYS